MSPRRSQQEAQAGSHQQSFAALCDQLEAWTGMALRGATPQRLRHFLERRAQHLGLSGPAAYIDYVCPQSPRAAEPARLINLVTNGLTAFWRDEPQLDAARQAMRDLHARHKRPLAIWCAGCSSGEEAYTVAMIAAEHDIPCAILGTDLNTEALESARAGLYGEWSLRRVDEARRAKHFVPKPHQSWMVRQALRQRVSFRHANLLDPAPRPLAATSWDLILCRNVFIYLREDAIARVLDRFAHALREDGYLMLGSSEQLVQERAAPAAPFRAARHGAGFVYRLHATPPGQTVLGLPLPGALNEDTPSWAAHALEEQTVDFDADQVVLRLMRAALDHIKRGQAEPALACCEAALSYDPFVVDTFCLLGLILMGLGAGQRAAEAFGKALFLDPLHWLSAFELARLHELWDRPALARQSYRQALEGLARGDDTPFGFDFLRDYFEREGVSRRREVREACLEALNVLG